MEARCPVCGGALPEDLLCASCGYDVSTDMESHPTLFSAAGRPSLKGLRSVRQPAKETDQIPKGVLCCSNCGKSLFFFLLSDRELLCRNCGMKIPIPTDEKRDLYQDTKNNILYEDIKNKIVSESGEQALSESVGKVRFSAEERKDIHGSCGRGLTWELNQDGLLTIQGKGNMENYGALGGKVPWYEHKNEIEAVMIEPGVTSIGAYAFESNPLRKVSIPATVSRIGINAFAHCKNLVSAVIPEGVESIGSRAFFYCPNLLSIQIPVSVTVIGDSAFSQCIRLSIVEFNARVQTLEKSLFYSCESLKKIVIPNRVRWIGENAFSKCIRLESVTLGSGVYIIEKEAFDGCTSLHDVYPCRSRALWKTVTVKSGNKSLQNAVMHFTV